MGQGADGQNKQWHGSNWLATLTESNGNDDETTGQVHGTLNEDDDGHIDCDADADAVDDNDADDDNADDVTVTNNGAANWSKLLLTESACKPASCHRIL